jgi:hypothetical protein
MFPLIVKLRVSVRKAAAESHAFVVKWKHRLDGGELKDDLRRLFVRYDNVTENAADIIARLGMRRSAKWLRRLIPDEGVRF